jgi:hypothetical protein
MINPPPRPALRKAPDSDVHPVAPLPSVPPSPMPHQRGGLRPVVGIGGRTSDTLVTKVPRKVKRVTVEVKVPKGIAKDAKRLAKLRSVRLDDIVTAALQDYVNKA